MRILLSRTDSIGDVVLTLPLAGILKESFPDCTILFLCKSYTRPVVERSRFVDVVLDWEDLYTGEETKSREKKAARIFSELKIDVIVHIFPVKEICLAAKRGGIPVRIATSHRFFTWFTCNRLVHFSRKGSHEHEALLNIRLLHPLGIHKSFDTGKIAEYYGFRPPFQRADHDCMTINPDVIKYIRPGIFNVILHPRSKGSAREWGLDNFGLLVELLSLHPVNIIVAGTAGDGDSMKEFLKKYQHRVTDLTGKLTLDQYFDLIAGCDALVAASTGPLHLAAALGIRAVGLYAPLRPIFPQRWAPLGPKATFLVIEKNCNACRKSGDCTCIRSIHPQQVADILIRDVDKRCIPAC